MTDFLLCIGSFVVVLVVLDLFCFLGICIGRYVVEMAALALIGGIGAFIGIRLRRHKDAKADTTKE